MKEFFAMMLTLSIIIGSVWGFIILFSIAVQCASESGAPPGLLYYAAGAATGLWYKEVGKGFLNFCERVFEAIHHWIIWR